MFKTYPSSKILEPYIAFFYTVKWQKKDYDKNFSELGLPSGYCILGFHSKGQCFVALENEVQKLPKFYVIGQQMQKHYKSSTADTLELYAAIFKPTGLWHLFGLDMPLFTDKARVATTLFKDGLACFTKEFEACQSPESRIRIIENLLIRKCLSVQPRLTFIDYAIQLIYETHGCSSITTIIKKLNVSERYFQKKFKIMVGISPCAYNRIVRFNFMFARMKSDTSYDYKSLAALFNYYDFPHFSNDFKKYCGVCPSKFNIEKFKFLQEFVVSEALPTQYQ